jgi:hypothetical protein
MAGPGAQPIVARATRYALCQTPLTAAAPFKNEKTGAGAGFFHHNGQRIKSLRTRLSCGFDYAATRTIIKQAQRSWNLLKYI